MALRMIEVMLSGEETIETDDLLKDHAILDAWSEKLPENRVRMKILLPVEETESVLNLLENRFSGREGFRVILLAVEATLPRPEAPESSAEAESTANAAAEQQQKLERISREELYTDIADTARLSSVYIVLVILSTIVAAIGILRSNVAIIIGSMVIAPLLGPNVALSLGTTLADMPLVRNSLKTNSVGIFIAFLLAVIIGYFLPVDPSIPEIAGRTRPDVGDIVLSLASGAAGALAFTSGLPAALVGVMVAVALLPPLVVLGMLLGSGWFPEAVGALQLLLINIICVNLAGVLTFLIQGIRPLTWWEKSKAKKATRQAILIWVLLLSVLTAIILLA